MPAESGVERSFYLECACGAPIITTETTAICRNCGEIHEFRHFSFAMFLWCNYCSGRTYWDVLCPVWSKLSRDSASTEGRHQDVVVFHVPFRFTALTLVHARGHSAMTKHAHLLDEVVAHKRHFFREGTAHYELAEKNTLRLAPGKRLEDGVRKDYEKMREMYFGSEPDFDEVMNAIRDPEKKINAS